MEVCLLLLTIMSMFKRVSSIPIMSWNLVVISSFTICSFESFLENPRKLNEQIRNEDIVFLFYEDSHVFPFLSLVSIVSLLSFLTVQRYELVAYLTVVNARN